MGTGEATFIPAPVAMEPSSRKPKKQKKQKPQQNPSLVPCEKLITNLKRAHVNNDSRQRVVLFQSGSYNPAHRMHIEMFEVARKYVESNEFSIPSVVVGGFVVRAPSKLRSFVERSRRPFRFPLRFMSPSHDGYVSHKMAIASGGPQRHFSCEERLEILRRASASSDCLDITAMECYDPASRSFNGVRCGIRLAFFFHLSSCADVPPSYVLRLLPTMSKLFGRSFSSLRQTSVFSQLFPKPFPPAPITKIASTVLDRVCLVFCLWIRPRRPRQPVEPKQTQQRRWHDCTRSRKHNSEG